MRSKLLFISLIICMASCSNQLDLYNQAPVFRSTPDSTLTSDGNFFYQITATDLEQDSIIFTVSQLPSWLQFDSENLIISGQAQLADIESYQFFIHANDGKNTTTQTVDLHVTYVLSKAETRANIGDMYYYQLQTIGNPQSYTVSGLPPWLNFDSGTAVLQGTPDLADQANLTINIDILDLNSISYSYQFQINVFPRFDKNIIGDFGTINFGNSVIQTGDGGYLIAGIQVIPVLLQAAENYWFLKTDALGNREWQSFFPNGVGINGFAESIIATQDNAFVYAGPLSGGGGSLIGKLSNTGTPLWQFTFGTIGFGQIAKIIETSDQGYVAIGRINYSDGVYNNLWIIKVDANGAQVWEHDLGGDFSDLGVDLAELPGGDLILLGTSISFADGQNDVWLVRTSSTGVTIWQKNIGYEKSERAHALTVNNDGSYAILASTTSKGIGSRDILLTKTDSEGNLLWDRTFGTEAFDQGHAIAATADGGYILSTEYRTNQDRAKLSLIIRTDADGNPIWQQTFGRNGEQLGHSIIQSSDGGFLVAGEIRPSGAFHPNLWLMKMDSLGLSQ